MLCVLHLSSHILHGLELSLNPEVVCENLLQNRACLVQVQLERLDKLLSLWTDCLVDPPQIPLKRPHEVRSLTLLQRLKQRANRLYWEVVGYAVFNVLQALLHLCHPGKSLYLGLCCRYVLAKLLVDHCQLKDILTLWRCGVSKRLDLSYVVG